MTRPDEGSWERIQELFHRALDLPASQRESFLDEASAGEPEVRRQVAALLDADGGSESAISGRVSHAAADLWTGGAGGEPAYRELGAYRLLEEIGHGGMGVVHLAERADGAYEHRVAVKLARGHIRTEAALERFRTERQILARLEHPAIARLLDGGAAPDGTPFLVMEYVDGVSIDLYCRENELSLNARVGLFLDVCAAVESAHQQLVVHRDLKPSNILVTSEGQPKLLDFGVAKLLDPAGDEVAVTETQLRALTPGYASPEQVRGESVTTVTDVFSLGVVLYEILTGQSPFGGPTATPEERLKAVLDTDPDRPSKATGDGGPTGSGLPFLGTRLSGELDAIILMSLRKEPARRYSSVGHLADDLRRYLAGLPVRAHTDSIGYRARKWMRRHWKAAAVAAIVTTALVLGLVARTSEARRADREARTAERVTDFLVTILEEADPESRRGEDLTVLEVVDRGAGELDELANEPLVQARLQSIIGKVYRDLGRYEPAEALLRRSLEQREAHGADPAEIAATLDGLGKLLDEASRFGEAETLLRRSLALRPHLRERDPVAFAQTETELGIVLIHSNQLGEAESIFLDALELRRRALGAETPEVARSLNNLAWVRSEAGRTEEAEATYRQALELKRRVLPANDASIATTLQNLAFIAAGRGEVESAESLLREALEILETVYGDEHPRYAFSLMEMASLLHDQARWEEAEALYRKALAVEEAALPEGSVGLATTLNNLAWLYFDQNDAETSVPLFERSLALRRQFLGDRHPKVAQAAHNLANAKLQLHELEEAEGLFRVAVDTYRGAGEGSRRRVAKSERQLAEVLLDLGRAEEALPFLEEALQILAEDPPESKDRAPVEAALVRCRSQLVAPEAK